MNSNRNYKALVGVLVFSILAAFGIPLLIKGLFAGLLLIFNYPVYAMAGGVLVILASLVFKRK